MKIKETGRIWLCSFDNDGSGDSVGTATDLEVAKTVCEKDAPGKRSSHQDPSGDNSLRRLMAVSANRPPPLA